jgi:hypothetical protein
VEPASVTDLVEIQFKAVTVQKTITIIDTKHVLGVLHKITSRIIRKGRVEKGRRACTVLLNATNNEADHSNTKVPILLYAETLEVMTTTLLF